MTIRTPAPMLGIDYQPLLNSPHLRPIQACTVPEPPPSMHVPDQPFRIVFMRWDKDAGRCSRIRTTLSFHPPEKPTTTSQMFHILEESDWHWFMPPSMFSMRTSGLLLWGETPPTSMAGKAAFSLTSQLPVRERSKEQNLSHESINQHSHSCGLCKNFRTPNNIGGFKAHFM